jgi:predicted short-subunit dehydrogenase-like oxidoreductase (DUF2520 family)
MIEAKNTVAQATVLIIGSGKLSKHLTHWFNLHKNHPHKLLTWDRHQDPLTIHKYVLQATHIWLAISDSAIIPVYEKYILGHDATVVHFSGALHDDRLISAHPLMSFTDALYDDDFYSKIHFALTGSPNLSEALPGFNNSYFELEASAKPFYHALCVVAGNFPQMLWSEVLKQAESKKIPMKAFDIYIAQIAKNFVTLHDQAVTGPFVRKDLTTIDKNIQALAGTALQPVYQTFQKEFLK